MERLSSGLRINSASDDAAGLAIASRMESQVRGLQAAIKNANDGISVTQTAEGAMEEIGNILQRMRELAVQSANDSNSDADRAYLQQEVAQLSDEITRISETTQFNGVNVLDGSYAGKTFQIGANANQSVTLDIANVAAFFWYRRIQLLLRVQQPQQQVVWQKRLDVFHSILMIDMRFCTDRL